jgi:peptide/nickel transport system substrate-binding protein
MQDLEALMRRFSAGRLDRRRFMQAGSALGLSTLALGAAADRALAAVPQKGGFLRVAKGHGSTSDSLDPAVVENGYTIALSFGFQGYLTQVGADGGVQPSVAESWESSPDAATWTFRLRRGVEFHNGRSVTADDVIASINHHRGEDTNSAAAPLVAPIRAMRADGDHVVVFELEAGNADFPFILTDYHLAIMPAQDGEMDWRSLVGCGAYRLDRFDAGNVSQLTRHANHWTDAVGHVAEVELLSVVDLNSRTAAVISGDVHAIDRVDLKTASRLGRNPGVNVRSVTGTLHYSFPMLSDRAPFDDVDLRQAMKYAFDRKELVEKILFGYGEVGNDHPIGRNQRFFNSELEQRVYDPERAMFHLRKAGLDGATVDLHAADAAFAGAVDAAVLVQNSAKRAGLQVNVIREPNDGFWSENWMKQEFITSYWSGRPVEDQMFSTAYQTGVAWNEAQWSDEQFDALLVAARAELDEARRRDMYFDMQRILNERGGSVIPMFASYVFATTDKVGTPAETAANWDMDGERWMERWWLV